MKKDISLSVFFPAYNEEDNIADSVKQADHVLRSITNTYEIIIVNDGSKDTTGEIAESLAKNNPHVRVIHHNPNQGYGAAVWTGIQSAKHDYVFFTDADLQFNLDEIKSLVKYIPEYEVVLGYRAKRNDPFMRLMNAKGWNILNRMLFGLKVRDIDCAFKLFKRRLVVDLPLKSRGAMLSAELLIHLQRKGIPFKEVPVTHLPRTAGSPTGAKPAVILRAFRELFQTYRGELGNITHKQLVKFAIVGIGNTLLDITLYFILTRLFPFFSVHVLVAKALSFLLASISSFVFNRYWTFRKQASITLPELVRFYITVLMAIIINVISLFVFLRAFHFFDLPAVVLATAVTFVWNFLVSKFWVFTNRQHTAIQTAIPTLDWAILLGLPILLTGNTLLWLKANNFPPHWDMANHLVHSLVYTDDFTNILKSTGLMDLLHKTYTFLIGRETYYPPFGYWMTVPFISIFGRTFSAAVLSNIVFITIFVFTLYALGKKLWNRTTGLLAALVMISFPFVIGQSHEFQLDLPLTAMTALCLWLLLQTNRWRNWGWSLVFGFVCGLGMLTKWPIFAFIIGPILYEFIGRIREIQSEEPGSRLSSYRWLFFGIGLSVVGFIISAGPWYGTHAQTIQQNFGVNWQTGTGEGDPSPLSIASLRLYSDVLIQAQIRLLLLIPFIIGIISLFFNRENLKKSGVLLSLLLGGYVIMTLYNNKDYRFIEPVLPAVALLSVYWISQAVKPWRYVAISYIIFVCLFQILSISWGPRIFPHLPNKLYAYIPDIQEGKFRLTVWDFQGYSAGPPQWEDWKQDMIINTVKNSMTQSNKASAQVAMYYAENARFNRENIQYTILQKKLPITIVPGAPATFNCTNIDYIIAKDTNSVTDTVYRNFPRSKSYAYNPTVPLENISSQQFCTLKELAKETLPDQSHVYLWQIENVTPIP